MTFFKLWSHHGFGFGHHGGYGHSGHHNDFGHHGFKFGLGCGSSWSSWGAYNNANMYTYAPQQPVVQLPVQQPIIADSSADDSIDMSFAVNDDAGANDLVLADDSSDLVFGNAIEVDSSGTLADSDAVSIMNAADTSVDAASDDSVVADDSALSILAASDASSTDVVATDDAVVADESLMFTTTVDDSASVPVVADDSGLGGETVTAVPPSAPINAVALTAGDDQYTDVAGVERVDGLDGTDVVGIDTSKAALGLTELADGSISIAIDGTEAMQIINVENIAVNDAALGLNADGKWTVLDSTAGDDINSLFPVSTFTNVDNPIMTVTGETTDTTVEIDTPTPGSTDAGVVIDGEVVYFPITSGTPPNDDNTDDADVVVTPPVTVTPDVPVIPSTPVVADSGYGWSGWGRWNNWHNSQVNVVNDDNGCGSKSYDYGHGGSSYGGHFGLFSGGCGLFGGLFHNVFSSGWSHGGHHDWGCC